MVCRDVQCTTFILAVRLIMLSAVAWDNVCWSATTMHSVNIMDVFIVLLLSWSLDSSQKTPYSFHSVMALLLHLVKLYNSSDRLLGLGHATFLLLLVGVYQWCVLGLLWLCYSRRRIWERMRVRECVSVRLCVGNVPQSQRIFLANVYLCVFEWLEKHLGTFCSDGPCVLKPATKKYALKKTKLGH